MISQQTPDSDVYAPSVSDRIQRVLYRLDHGEQLGRKDLYDGTKFCVLGMFADESGMGHWQYSGPSSDLVGRHRYNYKLSVKDFMGSAALLPHPVKQLYGFTTDTGLFMLKDLPDHVQKQTWEVYRKTYTNGPINDPMTSWSLASLNDSCLQIGYEYTNELLAKIIRSGAVFDKGRFNSE